MLWFVFRVSRFPFPLWDEVDGAERVSQHTDRLPHTDSFRDHLALLLTLHLQQPVSPLGRAVSCWVPPCTWGVHGEGAGETPVLALALEHPAMGNILCPEQAGQGPRCHSIPRGVVET